MPSCWSKTINVDCDNICHSWNPTCIGAFFEVLFACAKYSLKIYTIFYSVSFVLGRKGKEHFKKKFLREILQSSLFLTCNGCFFVAYFCFIRKIYGAFNMYTVGFIPGFLASLSAILVEKKSRRTALALYMLNQAYDTIFNLLKGFGYVNEIKYGEYFIFSIAMALLMYLYSSDSLPDGIVKTILTKCFKGRNNDATGNENLNGSDDHIENNVTIMKNSVLLGSKVLSICSLLHTTYSMLISLPKLIKKPNEFFYKAILRKDNFFFGAWLGSYAGIYDVISRLLKKYNKEGGHVNNAVAGGLAGVSILWHRKPEYALYIASKAIEALYMSGIKKGVVPYIKHFESFLYAFCTAAMFHTAVLQPLYLKSSYFRFLEGLTGERFMKVNREPLNAFGYDSTRIDHLPRPNPYTPYK